MALCCKQKYAIGESTIMDSPTYILCRQYSLLGFFVNDLHFYSQDGELSTFFGNLH